MVIIVTTKFHSKLKLPCYKTWSTKSNVKNVKKKFETEIVLKNDLRKSDELNCIKCVSLFASF